MQRRDVERVWPERLKIRDTGLHDDLGGPGQRIYTTAGRGYERAEYVRADLYDALLAERDAALAAAPQPAPAPADERAAMIEVIESVGWDGSDLPAAIADSLLAVGYRKAEPLADERETLAWAVVGRDGALQAWTTTEDKSEAAEFSGRGERVVRVAIRIVEDEA